ncbi:MAG: hypothetical protein JO288_10750 [Hyphomicrobiales bacterium]|nr:hypothetical protein [Hyphomicrobiales bacterium]
MAVEQVSQPAPSRLGASSGALSAGGYASSRSALPDVLAVVGLRFEARIIAGPLVRAVSGGMSGSNGLPAAIAKSDRGVISFGICGGLAPGLGAGVCIVASQVLDGTRVWRTNAAWSAHLLRSIPEAVAAPILGLDSPVTEVAEKRRLYGRHGAAAVDTESHLAASAASLHGLPFAAVRVIVDDARCRLVNAALAGRRSDGSISAAAVFRALLDRPDESWRLVLLAAKASSALATLMRLRPLFADGQALQGLGPASMDESTLGDRPATEIKPANPRSLFAPRAWPAGR